MISFEHTITANVGLHARPAAQIVKFAKGNKCTIQIAKGSKSAKASRLIGLMGLGAMQGDTIKITIAGEGEDAAATEFKTLLEEIL